LEEKILIDPGNYDFSEIVGIWQKVRKPLKPVENQGFHCRDCVISAKNLGFYNVWETKGRIEKFEVLYDF